jgi:carbon-monoxide dehydrogenase medium subunit
MIPNFVMHRPGTLDEVLSLLGELGDGARVYAGGTELLLVLREGFLQADHLVDIKRIPDLAGIHLDSTRLVRIGATTVHTDIERSDLIREHLPALAALESGIANVRVRNTGTLGGNLCFAEPHGDPATLLLAADAQVTIAGSEGIRTAALQGWVRGPFEVDLAPGEVLTGILIPLPAPRSRLAYRRFRALERPSAAVAVRVELAPDGSVADGRVFAGCVGPSPQRLVNAEAALRELRAEDVVRAATLVGAAGADEADVDTDAHGPADHKRQLIRVLARRAVIDAVKQGRDGLVN